MRSGEHKEELRNSLIEEIKASDMEGVPSDPTGYEIPEAFGTEETLEAQVSAMVHTTGTKRGLRTDNALSFNEFRTDGAQVPESKESSAS